MKITLELQNVNELSKLKNYAEKKGYTIDQLIDGIIKKASLKINEGNSEDQYSTKLDHYPINDFLTEKLKFKYLLLKDGVVACNQFGKLKEMKYSFDTGSGDVYVYLLLQGCPNKADIATLQKFSKRINLEDLYNQIYGKNTFEKYVRENVMKKIYKSQEAWKKKQHGGK